MTTATAPNTTTDAVANESASSNTEPIVKSGTGNDITISDFDDLEAATVKKKVATENARLDEKRRDFAEKQKAKREKTEVEVDDDLESESKKLEDKLEDEEKDRDQEEKEDPVKEKNDLKKIKIQANGHVKELPENAAIPVKINGKTEHVQLKDLLSNYSGKVVWEEKFRTLDLERKSFHNERDNLQAGINKLHELAMQGNPRAAIEYLAEAMGADPRTTWNNLKLEVAKVLKQYSNLTDEQIEAQELKEENEWLRKKNESAKAATLREQALAQTETTVRAIQETLGIDKQQFVKLYDELVAEARLSGQDDSVVTPEHVEKYYHIKFRSDQAKKIVSENFPNRESKEVSKIYDTICEVWEQNPNLTPKEIKDVAIEVYGGRKQSSLAKKLQKNHSEKNELRQPQTDPMDWDSL